MTAKFIRDAGAVSAVETLRDYCQEYGCERCGLERTMGVVIKKQDK